ncbi:hypothetical protein [Streptomyces sp. NPDC006324]
MLAAQWLHEGRHDDMAVVAITAPRASSLTTGDGYGRYGGRNT